MRTVLIFFCILLISCGGKAGDLEKQTGNNGLFCDDGRLVAEKSLCDIEKEEVVSPKAGAVPVAALVSETGKTVGSAEQAQEVFNDYVEEKSLDYRVISSSYYKTDGNVDYYKVLYSHDEVSGGKRTMLVDSEGNVLQEFGTA